MGTDSTTNGIARFIESTIAEVAGRISDRLAAGSVPPTSIPNMGYLLAPVCRVNFVEDKVPDYELLGRILRLSESINHWANFGPVVDITEQAYSRAMQLPATSSLILCSNGTVSLEILASAHEILLGRALRWVGSAFNFLNIDRGAFQHTTLIDCDERGLLSIDRLRELPANSYDGVIVTNTFGITPEYHQIVEFCHESKKSLLLDNAAGLGNRQSPYIQWQSISLHHTKPFGFGEGGAMICPAEHAALVRALISFAKGFPREVARRSTNAKLSDVSAAFLLARLHSSPQWIPLYIEQAQRVSLAAIECGLKPLINSDRSIAMSLPFMLQKPVGLAALSNPDLSMGRSYAVLAENAPVARRIQERVVNIPTHPGVARVADPRLLEILRELGA